MKCKITNEQIKPFMSFGKMPIANGFIKKNEISKEYFYSLETCFCKFCKAFQIKKQPDQKKCFIAIIHFIQACPREWLIILHYLAQI